jgi:4-amino-4-deoxy-L-arabinose transferase-like glycosyltransferase
MLSLGAMTPPLLDRWTRGWRGPWLAALIALAAALPGAVSLPVTDRAEARLAEASAQMLEERDFTATDVDDQASDRRPLGVHWMQAAAVALTSDAESRRIWAYRLPALAGAMAAAAACAWGGAALLGSGAGFLAGALLGASLLLSTAGAIDAPGALLCAGVTLAVSALARLRLAAGGVLAAGRVTRTLLWLGAAMAALGGGPVGPAAVVLTGACLWAAERRAPWLRSLGWSWGIILMAALVGPSIVAGAVAAGQNAVGQGGAGPAWPFLAIGGADAPRTPGFHLLISPLALFPFALVLPAGAVMAARARRDEGARLALCWLVPSWLVLEFSRGQPLAGGLIVYGAVAWLCAAAVREGIGPRAARIGAGLQALAAAVLIATLLYLALRFGDPAALAWTVLACALLAGAALGGGALLLRGRAWRALALTGVLGVVAHAVVLAGAAPNLRPLWLSGRTAALLTAAGLDPRDGVAAGPVAVAGFGEPSLAFALGGQTEDGTAQEAAAALREGRPAIVEAAQEDAFLAAAGPGRARRAGEVQGFDYTRGKAVRLAVYGPAKPAR